MINYVFIEESNSVVKTYRKNVSQYEIFQIDHRQKSLKYSHIWSTAWVYDNVAILYFWEIQFVHYLSLLVQR